MMIGFFQQKHQHLAQDSLVVQIRARRVQFDKISFSLKLIVNILIGSINTREAYNIIIFSETLKQQSAPCKQIQQRQFLKSINQIQQIWNLLKTTFAKPIFQVKQPIIINKQINNCILQQPIKKLQKNPTESKMSKSNMNIQSEQTSIQKPTKKTINKQKQQKSISKFDNIKMAQKQKNYKESKHAGAIRSINGNKTCRILNIYIYIVVPFQLVILYSVNLQPILYIYIFTYLHKHIYIYIYTYIQMYICACLIYNMMQCNNCTDMSLLGGILCFFVFCMLLSSYFGTSPYLCPSSYQKYHQLKQKHWRYQDYNIYIYTFMITQQLIRQAAGEQQNDRIYKLDLSNKLITRICSLRPFSKIRFLQLDFNRIRSIQNLECLPDLRELHLEFNQIACLAGLENNKMLTVLALSQNRIQKIQNIGHLIKLETLIIDNNRIQKISGLEMLKDLKYLSINGNKLSSIDSLPAFSKLQTLNAQKNMIRKISPALFSKSAKLLKLNLSFNQLEDVSFANSLISLEELNLSHNRISNFELSALKNLQNLNISYNKIQKLPKISILFPELCVYNFSYNEVNSQFEVIQSLAEAEMLVEIDYRGNIMQTPDFAETLYNVYGFDRINDKNYNKPGTRYLNQAQQINKIIRQEGLGEIQNDEDVRKIIISGFYNDDLETQMTGVKPDRPTSAGKNKMGPSLNFQQMEKSYHQIIKNQKRLQILRNHCLDIFKNNGIKVETPPPKEETPKQQQSIGPLVTEVKNLPVRTTSLNNINQLQNQNEQSMNKWKQLKNREKNFNIRGVVRKMSGSQKKSGTAGKQGSLSKIPNSQQRSQLMKTQLNPPRWNNDPALMKTLQARPFSAKKNNK